MNKVVIGMSGGVDSAVAAYLLKRQGYEVIGVSLLLWPEKTSEDASDNAAAAVAESLGIEHYTLDFRREFKTRVVDYFTDCYVSGRTPNPCIVCNRHIKWEALLRAADEYAADCIATGHYAKAVRRSDGRFCIQRSEAGAKDQSYALYRLTQAQLERTLFPLGAYTKPEVRRIAADAGIKVADKPDSQEICFIPDGDHTSFIHERAEVKAGEFVDTAGNVLGRHNGIIQFTIGQRKGLGVGFGKRMFVKSIDPISNKVTLADNDELFSVKLTAVDLNFMALPELTGMAARLYAKIRYNHKPAVCNAYVRDNILYCEFETPQRAVTPGQSVVLYDESGCVICGGVIRD